MCTQCLDQIHTEPQSPEPTETRAQRENRIDLEKCRQWVRLRGVPRGESLGEYRADSLDTHESLRDFLGGMWRHFTVEREPRIETQDIEKTWADSWLRKDGSRVPSPPVILRPMFSHPIWTQKHSQTSYEYPPNKDAFCGYPWTTETREIPTPSLTVASGQKVFRPILKSLKRWEHCSPELLEVWERFSEKMGQLWGKDEEKWGVTVSCAPSSFLGLGHYGEFNSCFASGGQYAQAPWALGCLPRSVVILIYRGEYDTPECGPRETPPSGRLWGQWGTDGTPGVLGSNLYKLGWPTVSPLLVSTVSQFWGIPEGDIETRDPLYRSCVAPGLTEEQVYFNGDDQILSPDPRGFESYIETQTSLESEKWGESRIHRCAVCEAHYDPDYEGAFCDFCGRGVCTECGTWFEDICSFYCESCVTPAYCRQCDAIYPEEDTTQCAGCETTICEACSESCSECGDPLCESCSESCLECGDPLCEACSESCSECGDLYCERCLPECGGCGSHICPDCDSSHRETECEQISIQGVI